MGGGPRRRGCPPPVRSRRGRSARRPGARGRGRRPVAAGPRALRRGGVHPPGRSARLAQRGRGRRGGLLRGGSTPPGTDDAPSDDRARGDDQAGCGRARGPGDGPGPVGCRLQPDQPVHLVELDAWASRRRCPRPRATPATIRWATSASIPRPPASSPSPRASTSSKPRPVVKDDNLAVSFTTNGPIAEVPQPLFDVQQGDSVGGPGAQLRVAGPAGDGRRTRPDRGTWCCTPSRAATKPRPTWACRSPWPATRSPTRCR